MSGALAGARPWLDRLRTDGVETAGDLLDRAEIVRRLPDRENGRCTVGGEVLFLKVDPRGRARRRPREVIGLEAAAGAGVPVPEIACYGWEASRGHVTATLDVAPAVPLDDALRTGLSATARHALADELARVVAGLHAGGRHHRDLYANHVYVDPGAGRISAVIDWDRSGVHRRSVSRRVVKDLAALWYSVAAAGATSSDGRRFLARYARARGLVGAASVARLAARVEGKARRIGAHTPRTPVGDRARPGGSS